MTFWQGPAGTIEATRAILSTSNADIIAAVESRTALYLIRIVNTSASAATLDLEILADSVSYYLAKGLSVAAGASVEFRDELLLRGDALKAKSGTASVLHIHVLHSVPANIQ